MRDLDSIYAKNKEWILQKAKVIALRDREATHYNAYYNLPRNHPDARRLWGQYIGTEMARRRAEERLERIEQSVLYGYNFNAFLFPDKFEDEDEFIERVSRDGYVGGTKL